MDYSAKMTDILFIIWSVLTIVGLTGLICDWSGIVFTVSMFIYFSMNIVSAACVMLPQAIKDLFSKEEEIDNTGFPADK